MSLTPQTWTQTNSLYYDPISINELAYINGTYVALPDSHPDFTSTFTTFFLSEDLNNWRKVIQGNGLRFEVEHVKIIQHEDYLFAVGLKVADTGNKFVSFISTNGTKWELIYESEVNPVKILNTSYHNGQHIVCCVGFIFVSGDGKTWNVLKLPQEHSSARVLGMAMTNDTFYCLLNSSGKSYIASTVDGTEFTVRTTPWLMESISLAGNGEQILVSARIKNKACVIYFSDDVDAYDIQSIPETPYDDNFLTVVDMKYINGEWIFACVREYYNRNKLKFSIHGFIFRNQGSLSVDSTLTKDMIASRNITTVKFVNNQYIAFGKVFPNLDNCLYRIEST